MNLTKRIAAFDKLGKELRQLQGDERNELCLNAANMNSWFTQQNVDYALSGIQKFLNATDLDLWSAPYDFPTSSRVVGIVMAGNVPLVGFHDLLCTLISGHEAMVKPSSADHYLTTYIIEQLINIEPAFKNKIHLVDRLSGMDAVIATGSDNTSRYFDYYFSKYPNIIRKNRTSVGIIKGHESQVSLSDLGNDIFTYFGLGCRNVSKLYVPDRYDFTPFFEAIEDFSYLKNQHKYVNNYDYNKAIYLVNSDKHLDNGFLLLKGSEALVSPISVLYYEEYTDDDDLTIKLEAYHSKIQCIVSDRQWWPESFGFGEAQRPGLSDYADHIDTMQFLCSL